MSIVGVIAEYNPFHLGHAFHLEQARRMTGASHVIVVMSGSYVQRGVPAMFDKYTRAQAALLNGADLVLELPPCTATGSAEYFAAGAVRILAETGIVTDLCFGSECGDLEALQLPAGILAEEPAEYRMHLKELLRTGRPYPEARMHALRRYEPSVSLEVLSSPNDLLGIEYLKALHRLHSPIRPHTLRRTGAAYHDRNIMRDAASFTDGARKGHDKAFDPYNESMNIHGNHEKASASGIRQAFFESHGALTDAIQAQLPSPELYLPYHGKTPVTEDAFSLLLLERLIRDPQEDLSRYFGVTEELSNRIRNRLDEYRSFSQFTDRIKTRNLTRTAVSRALLHILLGISGDETADSLRVLGFRREAAPLLKECAQSGHLPLITSPSDPLLPGYWLYADRLYERVRSLLHGQPFRNECRRRLLVI